MAKASDGGEDVPICSEDKLCKEMETFLLVSNLCHIEGFRVTTEETSRIIISTFKSFRCALRRRFSFFTDNDSDTEINEKRRRSFSCVRTSTTHTHCPVAHRALHKYWKKYEIIKILDGWYWFLLIFHYKEQEGEAAWWNVSSFLPVRTFFSYVKSREKRRSGMGNISTFLLRS